QAIGPVMQGDAVIANFFQPHAGLVAVGAVAARFHQAAILGPGFMAANGFAVGILSAAGGLAAGVPGFLQALLLAATVAGMLHQRAFRRPGLLVAVQRIDFPRRLLDQLAFRRPRLLFAVALALGVELRFGHQLAGFTVPTPFQLPLA